MKLIGLSGTNGSGKDSTAELLVTRYNYFFVSVTDLLRHEARKRELPVEREVLRTISAEWRRESGLGVLVEKAVELYQQEGGDTTYDGLVVASLRNPGEVDTVHQYGGKVIWVDADPKIRYDRVFSRQRSNEDNKSFDEFLNEEKAEMLHSGDEATLSMAAVRDKADSVLQNNGSTMAELEKTVSEQIGDLL